MGPTIALLTDFGVQDPYVGIMKGVITNLCPTAQLIDIVHEINPGNISHAAVQLWQSAPYFPKGTIFLAVVDPGVGTSRTPIIMQTEDHIYIGPDNGIFSFVIDNKSQAWALQNPAYQLSNPGMTFHGRDIFAPAAAHAALGTRGPKFGTALPELVKLPNPILKSTSQGLLHGEIMFADHFGNLITSLGKFHIQDDSIWLYQPWIGDTSPFQLNLHQSILQLAGGKTLPWAQTFGKIPGNTCAAIIGSSGLIEIVANGKSAAKILSLESSNTLTLKTIQP